MLTSASYIDIKKRLPMKKIFKIFTFISLITLSYAQGLDKKSVFYNLGDAVEYAHQMNLNVLIEDFTGVD